MKDMLRIALRLLILFLIAPLIYFGMGWHELGETTTVYGPEGREKQYAINKIKPRSFYHAETVRGEAAIARLGEHHRVMTAEEDTNPPQLVAASDYAGDVIVVAGQQAQLYIFRKKKKQYQLAQVLWDGKQDRTPKSLAISESGRYAAMAVESLDIPEDIARHNARYHLDWRLQLQVFWDLEKGEKIQDGLGDGAQRLGRHDSEQDLVAVGNTLFMTRDGGIVLNADFSWKKEFSDIYVGKPRGDFYSNKQEHRTQAAYAPLSRQILRLKYPRGTIKAPKRGEEQELYRVYDESREKWWKWWSNQIDLQLIPDMFSVYDTKADKYPENGRMFPALEIAPDGKFFVIWRGTGMLEAYSLPEGERIAKTMGPSDMARPVSPHLIIRDGTVYATNSNNVFTQESLNRYWSWKPGSAEALRAHYLSCAEYTRLLASGHMLTLGCRDSAPKLGLVALADNTQTQTFSLPLKMP
ncbi:MAG: hypothetical protein LBJ59_10265 [Zoogloeaceae bacterium]|nr:hypothetical protein [Zoogloeaceae bacterium]